MGNKYVERKEDLETVLRDYLLDNSTRVRAKQLNDLKNKYLTADQKESMDSKNLLGLQSIPAEIMSEADSMAESIVSSMPEMSFKAIQKPIPTRTLEKMTGDFQKLQLDEDESFVEAKLRQLEEAGLETEKQRPESALADQLSLLARDGKYMDAIDLIKSKKNTIRNEPSYFRNAIYNILTRLAKTMKRGQSAVSEADIERKASQIAEKLTKSGRGRKLSSEKYDKLIDEYLDSLKQSSISSFFGTGAEELMDRP